jgi:hypothetical protein
MSPLPQTSQTFSQQQNRVTRVFLSFFLCLFAMGIFLFVPKKKKKQKEKKEF